jgi:hypothetical protein
MKEACEDTCQRMAFARVALFEIAKATPTRNVKKKP